VLYLERSALPRLTFITVCSLFKFVFRERAARLEEKDVAYAILGRAIRDGGIKMACVARYSVIPAHRTSASSLFAWSSLNFVQCSRRSSPPAVSVSGHSSSLRWSRFHVRSALFLSATRSASPPKTVSYLQFYVVDYLLTNVQTRPSPQT
jgi:hypothetical protein